MQEIEELKRQGLSIRAISRLTGYCRKSFSKYLNRLEGSSVYGPRPPQASKLDSFKPYLEERMCSGVWNARVLLRELRQHSYAGSYTILTGLVAATAEVGMCGGGATLRNTTRQAGPGGLGSPGHARAGR